MAEYLERDPGIKVYDAFYIRHLRKLSCFSYAVHREMQMFKDSASIDWNSFHPTTCYIKIYRNSLYAARRPLESLDSVYGKFFINSFSRNPFPNLRHESSPFLRPRFVNAAKADVVIERSLRPSLTRIKRNPPWKALTMVAAVTLTVPRTYVEINCSPALSFFSVARRVIYVEDKGGGGRFLSRAYRPPRFLDDEHERRGEEKEIRAHASTRGARDCRGPGKAGAHASSWSRANGIARVRFCTLRTSRMGSTTPLRMMTTRIDSWTDYSIRSSAPLGFRTFWATGSHCFSSPSCVRAANFIFIFFFLL